MTPSADVGAAAALAKLTHRRWALPVLAHVVEKGGCKLVTLSKCLGVAAPNLRGSLDLLEELGLVVRNPGYGHPLRPEYILGPVGLEAGELPGAIVAWSERTSGQVLKKWQLPVLVALNPEVRRFGEIRGQLPGATARAVSMALKSHAALGLVRREVVEGFPPVPRYLPTAAARAGREPARLLGALLAG